LKSISVEQRLKRFECFALTRNAAPAHVPSPKWLFGFDKAGGEKCRRKSDRLLLRLPVATPPRCGGGIIDVASRASASLMRSRFCRPRMGHQFGIAGRADPSVRLSATESTSVCAPIRGRRVPVRTGPAALPCLSPDATASDCVAPPRRLPVCPWKWGVR
jgi:hypothetical protein